MDTSAGRRRSQRLFLQVRIIVEGTLPNKSPFSEDTHTIIVNAHGALVEMGTSLDQGQIVTMRNVRTSENIECTVKLVTRAAGGKYSTAFEFTNPNPGFWRISFPPKIGPSVIRKPKGAVDPPGDVPDLRHDTLPLTHESYLFTILRKDLFFDMFLGFTFSPTSESRRHKKREVITRLVITSRGGVGCCWVNSINESRKLPLRIREI